MWDGGRQELIKRRIKVWIVLGVKHSLSLSIISLFITVLKGFLITFSRVVLMLFGGLQPEISALCFGSTLEFWLVVSHLIPLRTWPNFCEAADPYTHVNLYGLSSRRVSRRGNPAYSRPQTELYEGSFMVRFQHTSTAADLQASWRFSSHKHAEVLKEKPAAGTAPLLPPTTPAGSCCCGLG